MCKVNKKLALINTFCISYSLLMLGFYHYSYAIIYSRPLKSTHLRDIARKQCPADFFNK